MIRIPVFLNPVKVLFMTSHGLPLPNFILPSITLYESYKFPIFISDYLKFHKNNIDLHSVAMTSITSQWNFD